MQFRYEIDHFLIDQNMSKQSDCVNAELVMLTCIYSRKYYEIYVEEGSDRLDGEFMPEY